MRISRPLPIAIGLSLVLVTGVADATSTTCTRTVVCAEYIRPAARARELKAARKIEAGP